MDVDIIKSTLQFHNQMETLAVTRIHVAVCELSNDLIIYECQVHHWEFSAINSFKDLKSRFETLEFEFVLPDYDLIFFTYFGLFHTSN